MLEYEFIYSKPKGCIIVVLVILLSCIGLLFVKTYSCLKVTGLLECEENTCVINLSMPYNELEVLDNASQLEYNQKKYSITGISRGEPYLNNNIPFEDVVIYTEYISDANVIDFKIIYDKQRIIKKIIKAMKE